MSTSAFLGERYQLAPPASTDIAGELLVRALFGVEEPLKELPGEASIAADVDLTPIRRAVASLLPSERVGRP